MKNTISGGGLKISPEQAYWLLKNKSNVQVMCKEYAEELCTHCQDRMRDCDCWSGMTYEDIEDMTLEDLLNSDWKTFEIW